MFGPRQTARRRCWTYAEDGSPDHGGTVAAFVRGRAFNQRCKDGIGSVAASATASEAVQWFGHRRSRAHRWPETGGRQARTTASSAMSSAPSRIEKASSSCSSVMHSGGFVWIELFEIITY